MSLIVECPEGYEAERRYILDVVLKRMLGLSYEAVVRHRDDVRITLRDDPSGADVLLCDVLFKTPREEWLSERSLPQRPLARHRVSPDESDAVLVEADLPLIYGEPVRNGSLVERQGTRTRLALDVLGSAFFMLTRYEELMPSVRDVHGRFPASASLAFRERFLERPLINEYVELLWSVLRHTWPRLERKRSEFRIIMTHDIDVPLYSPGAGLVRVSKSLAADLLRRRDPSLIVRRLRSGQAIRRGVFALDPFNTFDFIMDLSDRYGLRSAFYFIADESGSVIDRSYRLDDPFIAGLMKRIGARGHEIGLHGSYNSYREPSRVKQEFERLLQEAERQGIRQDEWGGRQHYLRWENPLTWRGWDAAGLDYDSSLTYVDHLGFRSGICNEYPAFDLDAGQPLRLRERPLLVMEGTLFSHMKLSADAAIARTVEIARRSMMYGGDFVLLWHNHSLASAREREIYRTILQRVVDSARTASTSLSH